MGMGEDWLGLWSVFFEQLGPDAEVRLAYLRRHPPAPFTWADSVHQVLHPAKENEDDDSDSDDDEDPLAAAERRSELLALGLIASDIAFSTWLGQQESLRWPWERHPTPEIAARHDTTRASSGSGRAGSARFEAKAGGPRPRVPRRGEAVSRRWRPVIKAPSILAKGSSRWLECSLPVR